MFLLWHLQYYLIVTFLLFVEVAEMAGGAELVESITGTHQGASRSESLVVSRKFLLL